MSDYAHDDPTGPASVAETAGALDAPDAPEGGYGVPPARTPTGSTPTPTRTPT